MYLGTDELLRLVNTVIDGVGDVRHPFDQNSQVKACSIDIRVGQKFWHLKKRRKPIDLGGDVIFDVSPRRLWVEKIYSEDEALELRPGEMILGRTHEKIFIPEGYVGKINTRSSFARLGISTACNCDLINPGYRGHVPLEITNVTKNTLLLRPYLSLCQIFIMPIQGKATPYDDHQFNSKYMNDDGGPSLWWRDSISKRISGRLSNIRIDNKAIEDLLKKFSSVDDEGFSRFDELISDGKFISADDILRKFHGDEKRRRLLWWVWTAISYGGAAIFWGFFAQSIIDLINIGLFEPNNSDFFILLMALIFSALGAKRYWDGPRNFYPDV